VGCLLPEAVPVLEELEIGLERYQWSSNVIKVLTLCLYWTSIWPWERYQRWMALEMTVSC
jgi:hypothetical protein